MFHLAEEVKEILETLVVVVEVVSVGMKTLVVAESSVVKVAAVVMMGMVAVGTAVVDLVMMEAMFKVAESTMILAITTISLQISDP